MRAILRRLSDLEETVPRALTAELFLLRAQKHARRSGDLDASIAALLRELSDSDLDLLTVEFEELAFGSDLAARDAARSRVLAASGYPDWSADAPEQESQAR